MSNIGVTQKQIYVGFKLLNVTNFLFRFFPQQLEAASRAARSKPNTCGLRRAHFEGSTLAVAILERLSKGKRR